MTKNDTAFSLFNKQSIVIATGVIVSRVRYRDYTTRFTLKNTDGLILVNAPLRLALKKGDPVSIIGYLGAHLNPKCSPHPILQAVMVLSAVYPKLWDDIGIPALLRAVHALETQSRGEDD